MTTRGRPRYPDTLTPRQQEVLALVREGLTNEEIAQRLGITLDGAKAAGVDAGDAAALGAGDGAGAASASPGIAAVRGSSRRPPSQRVPACAPIVSLAMRDFPYPIPRQALRL